MYRKTYRTKIDDTALDILQRSYWNDPKPSSQEKEVLAQKTHLSYKTVSIW
ncbi:hypothetical protein DSO57_1020829 [Entomophthora muscae]|nr:hypothetical protein DSO57_1020829 [Entomophthora muscae]